MKSTSNICNLCGSDNNEIIYDWTRFERNNVLQCIDCGLVFLERKDTEKETESFYKEEYRKVENQPVQSPEEHYNDLVTIKDTESQFDFISFYLTKNLKGNKILEIGSASGRLLDKMREAGAQVDGLELNDAYREFSRKRGHDVFGTRVELLEAIEQYNVVVSFHTIEHFTDPRTSFRAIYTTLEPDGLFLGEVPNQDEWCMQLFDNEVVKRLHYNPHHYYYFSPETLHKYLKAAGFRNRKIETVERYNSIMQLRLLLNTLPDYEIETCMASQIFPKNNKEDSRLHVNSKDNIKFNSFFKAAVNKQLMGNCIQFVARK